MREILVIHNTGVDRTSQNLYHLLMQDGSTAVEWNPGDAVAAARRMRGRKSQQWLADRLTEITGESWSRDMVANLENDRRTFDVPILLAICEALDVPTGFILFGHEPTANSPRGVQISSLGLVPA